MQEFQKACTEHKELADQLWSFPLLSYSYFLKRQVYWQMSWLHSGECGSFQMQRLCEDDLSSDTKAAGLGGFLLKFHSIRTLVTTGTQNHFSNTYLQVLLYQSLCPSQKNPRSNLKATVQKTILFAPDGSLLNQHSHSPSPLGPLSGHQDILLLQPILFMLLNRFSYLIRTGCS